MNIKRALSVLFCALALSSSIAQAQTTTITTEYLLTLYAPLEVRATLQTADEALIFMAYNGVIRQPPEQFERFMNGEVLKADEGSYVKYDIFVVR